MNRLTLTATCCVLSAATFLTTSCYRQSPDLVKASRSDTSTRSPGLAAPASSGSANILESDFSMQEALTDLTGAPQASMALKNRHRKVQGQWEAPLTATPAQNRETYASLSRNATVQTLTQPVSTFSVDVDTCAYSNVRRFLQNGQLPPKESVRVEELLNYFTYAYAKASGPENPFSVTTEVGKTPWNDKTHLLHIGLKGYVPPATQATAANLVFLIDVSGSMESPDKLGLLKFSISLLSHELTDEDTVSIVVYAGSSNQAAIAYPNHAQLDPRLREIAQVSLRYKLPEASESLLRAGVRIKSHFWVFMGDAQSAHPARRDEGE